MDREQPRSVQEWHIDHRGSCEEDAKSFERTPSSPSLFVAVKTPFDLFAFVADEMRGKRTESGCSPIKLIM
jgi:hypothetical protein